MAGPSGAALSNCGHRGTIGSDLNCWNLHNPRERFWASRTKQLHAAHVTTYDRLWSTLPYLRPMLTITKDTIQYGVDADGGRCHDLLGTRCDPYVTKLLSGQDVDFTCHSNLVRAVLPWGLTEFDVRDVLNVFQVTGLTKGHRPLFHEGEPGQAGRLLRGVRRDRCAVRTLDLSGRGSVDPVVGAGRARSHRGLSTPGRRGVPAAPELLEGWPGETEHAFRAQVARRQLPFRHRGGRVVFLRAELEEFLRCLPGVNTAAINSVSVVRPGCLCHSDSRATSRALAPGT